MRKIILIYLVFFLTSSAFADQKVLKVTWFGSTCVALSDGTTSILFDPFFTRPSLWQVATFQGLKSDPEIVKQWLSKIDAPKFSAVLTSHSHYDHVLDLVEVAKTSGAQVYGSESTKNIALGGGVKSEKIELLKLNSKIKVGDFEITVSKGEHPPHFLGFMLASGKITKPLKKEASAYAYKKDEDYSFFIRHPNANILFHPSGNTNLNAVEGEAFTAELVMLGVANRTSSKELFEKVVLPSGAKTVIPLHFDDIFTPLHKNPKNLMGVDMPEFYKTAAGYEPKVKTLKIGETFNLIR